jgi:hypothetical protein
MDDYGLEHAIKWMELKALSSRSSRIRKTKVFLLLVSRLLLGDRVIDR